MSDAALLNTALLRLRQTVNHPGGDTIGMLDETVGRYFRWRAR